MQGTIAQTIGLVLAVNARARDTAAEHFWPESSIFQFCEYVRFVDPRAKALLRRSPKIIAQDPNQWIERCAREGVGARLHLVRRNDPNISDRNAVGFVGGGPRWIIEIVRKGPSELWEDSWEVGDQEAPDRRIWRVNYFRISDDWTGGLEALPSLAELSDRLEDALVDILKFAREAGAGEGFIGCFEKGLKILRSEESSASVFHADLVPVGALESAAKRLLFASQAAWVFGGMGSWNDAWFEKDDAVSRYEEVSDRLFTTMVEAIAVATNSSFPGAAHA